MAYTDAQKALAVQFIRRSGGHLNDETIAGVRDLLSAPGLSGSTLHGWLKLVPSSQAQPIRDSESDSKPRIEAKKEIPAAALSAADDSLDALFEKLTRTYANRALDADAVALTKGKDAVIAAATALDKLRLIRGLPTEIVAILPVLLSELELAGLDAASVMNAMIAKAHAARMRVDAQR